MQKSRAVCCAVTAIAAGLIAPTAAKTADSFRKLTAGEIKSNVSGMEIEDVGEHWAEQYMRKGSLKVFALDKRTTGKWRVQALKLGPWTRDVERSGCRTTTWSSAERDLARDSKAFCRSNSPASDGW